MLAKKDSSSRITIQMKGDLTKHSTHRHVFDQNNSLFPEKENSITDSLPGVLSSLTWKEILLSETPISLDEKRCCQENKQRRKERERRTMNSLFISRFFSIEIGRKITLQEHFE